MLKQEFEKKFSIGLALESDSEQYRRLFTKYENFIDNMYFSPPLGDKYHGRTKIAEQFHNEAYVDRFWGILEQAREFNIKLEVVFNTHYLDDRDVEQTCQVFDDRGFLVEKVCVQDQYYDSARKYFPTSEIVHSVNCMPDDKKRILAELPKYEEYVVGRGYTRDSELFKEIEKVGTRCVLLLNNGCSHICGGCGEEKHCFESFEISRKTNSPQDIYAIQSIMPWEIHEGIVDLSNVSLLKLSTRNADVDYIEKCLDSYINNKAKEYIDQSTDYYLLWSRLRWMVKYFPVFQYSQIVEKKIKRFGKYGL